MDMARTPSEIKRLLKETDGSVQKIRRKPKKFFPERNKRSKDKEKFNESFGGEGV